MPFLAREAERITVAPIAQTLGHFPATLQREIRDQRERQQADLLLLREDVARYQDMALPERSTKRHEPEREGRKRSRGRDFGFER